MPSTQPFQKLRDEINSPEGRLHSAIFHANEVRQELLVQNEMVKWEAGHGAKWQDRMENLRGIMDASFALSNYLDPNGIPEPESPNGIPTPNTYIPEHVEHLVMVLRERMEINVDDCKIKARERSLTNSKPK